LLASIVVYVGLAIAFAGVVFLVRPIHRLRVTTRAQGLSILVAGIALAAIGVLLPAPESSVASAQTRLDEFAPVWQFHEQHTLDVAAPPARVFDAIRHVRADEIFLFRTLTWIRRGGQPLPPGILNAGGRESLIDLAVHTSCVLLAEDAPRELVVGTVVMAPPGTRGALTPQIFQRRLPDGFALATINFLVTEQGPGRSRITTETRVFANSAAARRRFAAYWRVIYPGSAISRLSWLRAIGRRATAP
jgi:hypothetical protein